MYIKVRSHIFNIYAQIFTKYILWRICSRQEQWRQRNFDFGFGTFIVFLTLAEGSMVHLFPPGMIVVASPAKDHAWLVSRLGRG
jgi:hypothetical protein